LFVLYFFFFFTFYLLATALREVPVTGEEEGEGVRSVWTSISERGEKGGA